MTEHPAAGYLWIPDEISAPKPATTPEDDDEFLELLIAAMQEPISDHSSGWCCIAHHADLEEEDVD